MKSIHDPSRRAFLKTGVATMGGLVIGFYLPDMLSGPAAEAASATSSLFTPNAWLRIGENDEITIVVAKSEMGQGVMTSMPMLVAEELEADWGRIKVEQAAVDAAYNNPTMGGMVTAGSTSVRTSYMPLRRAGAAARMMLTTAAAKKWGVSEETCRAEKGSVIHSQSGRRLSYGALAKDAATEPVPREITLKKPEEFRLLGTPVPRLDIPDKVIGRAIFGLDVKLPGMRIARVAHCPVFGGTVSGFDASRAKAIKGVTHVFQIDSGVAVVADSFWTATQGLKALQVQWNEGANAHLDSAGISSRFAELAKKPGAMARNDGDAAGVLARAARKIEAVYELPYLAHAAMEPMNCTADVRRDGCDIWVGTQAQTNTQETAARITGLASSTIKVHTTFLGGGFGRRGPTDVVAEAVQISKTVGAPVKVVWTREDDIQHDFYRPANYCYLAAALDDAGMPIAWMHRIVGPSLMAHMNPEAFKGGVDRTSVEGAANLPYRIPNIQVDYVLEDPGIPVGFWRSVGNSINAFVVESFLDEIAAVSGKDPYQLRIQLLDQAPRHRRVVEFAAEIAGWGKPLPQGRTRGIALCFSFGSYVAEVAEISLSTQGDVRVHRVVCAADCGSIVNPNTVEAQIEGAMVWGLTAALRGEITIRNGRVEQSNFHDYRMARMNEMPAVEVHIVPSPEPPGGAGEPGAPPIAPAIGNAIFAAVGKRIRRLPIRPEDLRHA